MPTQFNQFALSEPILKAVELLGYTQTTPVQSKTIPAILENKDVIIESHTGSGKTAAFAIPLCHLIEWEENKPQVLVIAPTRELAIQVNEDFFHIGRLKRIKAVAVFGKAPFSHQQKTLKQKTHVVVGTPGRLIDHLTKGTLDVSAIKYLVIDEADEMLKMGFVDDVETIIKALSKERVTIVLSATMPDDIKALCSKYMRKPEHLIFENAEPAHERIKQTHYDIKEGQKLALLDDLLIVENPDSCMIFCNTQVKVDEVYRGLKKQGLSCDKIHGGMEQPDRLRVMSDFKRGVFRFLVATDVAARGIDIDQVGLVINYDVPNQPENYVHRIGRTGRIGNAGRALTFVTPSDKKMMAEIHDYIGKSIDYADKPEDHHIEAMQDEFDEKSNTQPELKEGKGVMLNDSILKLHINAGKKTKMRAVDIVGTLCSIEGMTAQDIGIINIMDISTYVEILNDKGEMVYRELQNKPIKGRIRRVSKAEQ